MISELSRLKLGAGWDKETAALRLGRMLAFPSAATPLFACDTGRLIYPAGSLLIVDADRQSILKGHDAEITAFSFCPAKQLMATGQASSFNAKDYESPIIVWDASSLAVKKILVGMKRGVRGLAFSESGSHLAAVSSKNNLVIWQTGGMTVVHQRMVEFEVQIIGCTGHLYYTIGSSLYEFNLKSLREETFAIPSSGLKRGIVCMCSLGTEGLVFGTTSGELLYFQKKVFKNAFSLGKGGVNAILAQGSTFYISVGTELCVAEYAHGKMVEKLRTNIGQRAFRIERGDHCIYLQTPGNLLKLSSSTLEGEAIISANIRTVVSMHVKDRVVATADQVEGKIIDPRGMAVSTRLKNNTARNPSTITIANDQQVVVGFKDGTLKCYQLTGEFVAPPIWEISLAHKGAVRSVYMDRKYMLTGGDDCVLRIWARSNHQQLNQVSAHQKPICRVLPDLKDPSLVHSCSQDKSIHTYNLKADRKEDYHQEKNGVLLDMAQLNSGGLVTVGFNTGLSVWTVGEYYAASHVDIPIKLTCIALAPGAAVAAVGNEFGEVWLFETGRFGFLGKQEGHSSPVSGLGWVSDSQLISSGLDGTVIEWMYQP